MPQLSPPIASGLFPRGRRRVDQVQPARVDFALLDPQVARGLWLRGPFRVVLPVVDELDRDHF